jgi:hypothetical protein
VAGRYEYLPEEAQLGSLVVTPDLALHAVMTVPGPRGQRTVLFRHALNARSAEEEWVPGEGMNVKLETGP